MAFMQFFRTTAAALTSAIPAVVMFLFCTSWVLWVADSASPKPSSPWNVGYFWSAESESQFCWSLLPEKWHLNSVAHRQSTTSRTCYGLTFWLVRNKFFFPELTIFGAREGRVDLGHWGALTKSPTNSAIQHPLQCIGWVSSLDVCPVPHQWHRHFSPLWCCRPYKPHSFCEDMILAMSYHHQILIWWSWILNRMWIQIKCKTINQKSTLTFIGVNESVIDSMLHWRSRTLLKA